MKKVSGVIEKQVRWDGKLVRRGKCTNMPGYFIQVWAPSDCEENCGWVLEGKAIVATEFESILEFDRQMCVVGATLPAVRK